MDRRETLKSLMVGAVAGATLGPTACSTPDTVVEEITPKTEGLYGRTPEELARDQKLRAEICLNEHELESIAVLCDIILPATGTAGSATEAEVPEFIEFIVKDIPAHQLPMRGGLMWLDGESNRRFNKVFNSCSNEEQIQIVDDIAYPDPDNAKPQMAYGIKFFSLMRNLTITGYYTTKIGIDDLGYIGNQPNVWDGIPADVLAEHDVDYDPEWLAKCVDQSKRNEIAKWDDAGNLLT
ncbi:MAG: gluconate 2-dehydrogenase subunit 3 family protein [Cyclobacteriaceae bacterium]|nr:gluconate 2-dehydrogenase subunit 3 family protein [Cyclobacteriaceae bacterium]